jgi:hypothetical protein
MKEKYWVIAHNADTTETGMPTRKTYVKTVWQGFLAQQSSEADILADFCFKRFGDKTAYIQGVAPCPNWRITESDEKEYKACIPIKVGGYGYQDNANRAWNWRSWKNKFIV